MFFSEITHLNLVLKELKLFGKHNWQAFGLEAGLYDNKLQAIKANNPGNVETCLHECVASWLKRQDNVDVKGKPSLLRLADIVEETGDKATADEVRNKIKETEDRATAGGIRNKIKETGDRAAADEIRNKIKETEDRATAGGIRNKIKETGDRATADEIRNKIIETEDRATAGGIRNKIKETGDRAATDEIRNETKEWKEEAIQKSKKLLCSTFH